MKKSKLLVLSLVAVTSIGLASCGGNDNSSSSVAENATSSVANTTSEVKGKEYVIFVEDVNHATVEANKQVASAGETVTLTINTDDGYEFTTITVNGEVISGTSFVMPNRSVSIKVTVELVVKGDYVLTGDVSEDLTKDPQTGLYVARNVKVSGDSKVIYRIKGKELSVLDVNASKCFADIHLPLDNKGGFVVSGGYTYDFYYDPSDPKEPCYVKRTNVDTLPSTPEQLETLFDGKVRGDTSVNPDGVTKVEYSSTERNDSYVWEKYSDNASLATVTTNTASPRSKGSVYKSIDNNVYTVVDSYIENHSGHCITTTESDDRSKFSAKYDVVTSVDYGYSKYQKTSKEALVDVNKYSHTMESLDFDIMYCYRTGFRNDVSDDEYKYKIDVNSVWANDHETFTTTVNSYVTVVAAGTQYSGGSSYHNEFDVTMTFTKSGALLDLEYTEKNFDTTQYDVQNDKFILGHNADDAKSEKYVTAKYTYGESKSSKPSFDTTPYFISSLTNAKIVDSKGDPAVINKLDTVSLMTETLNYVESGSKYVSIDYEPRTALDLWQYGIVSSSNKDVVGHRFNDPAQYPFEFVGSNEGTSTLTIGNHTASTGVKATVTATVPEQTGNVRQVFVYSVYPYQNDNWIADKGTVFAGMVDEVKLAAALTNGAHDMNPNVELTCSNPALVDVTYDKTTGYMKVDASRAKNITTATTVTISINASYETGRAPSSISVTIAPAPHLVESLVGTWDLIDKDGNVVDDATGYPANVAFNDDGTGVLTAKADGHTYVVNFTYEFEMNRQIIRVRDSSCTKDGQKYGSSVDLMFDIDFQKTGYLGCYCLINLDYSYDDSGETNVKAFQLFGSSSTNSETGDTNYSVEDFKFRG